MNHSNLRVSITVFVLINTAFWTPLRGQEPTGTVQRRIGVGVTIGSGSNIYIPISVSPRFRIEPTLSYSQSNREYETFEYRSESLNIGTGIFPMMTRGNVQLYYGSRVGYTFSSTKRNIMGYGSSLENSESGFYVAPTIGGEYSIMNRFSLGAEITVTYSSLSGERHMRDEKEDLSTLNISTGSKAFFRFYL